MFIDDLFFYFFPWTHHLMLNNIAQNTVPLCWISARLWYRRSHKVTGPVLIFSNLECDIAFIQQFYKSYLLLNSNNRLWLDMGNGNRTTHFANSKSSTTGPGLDCCQATKTVNALLNTRFLYMLQQAMEKDPTADLNSGDPQVCQPIREDQGLRCEICHVCWDLGCAMHHFFFRQM